MIRFLLGFVFGLRVSKWGEGGRRDFLGFFKGLFKLFMSEEVFVGFFKGSVKR